MPLSRATQLSTFEHTRFHYATRPGHCESWWMQRKEEESVARKGGDELPLLLKGYPFDMRAS